MCNSISQKKPLLLLATLFLIQQSVKKYPCRHCEQSFNSTISLRRHNRNNHDGKKKIYTCWYVFLFLIYNVIYRWKNKCVLSNSYSCEPFPFSYCTDTKTIFTTSVMLKNHISLMHGIKNPDLGQMLKTSIQDSKKSLGMVCFLFCFF